MERTPEPLDILDSDDSVLGQLNREQLEAIVRRFRVSNLRTLDLLFLKATLTHHRRKKKLASAPSASAPTPPPLWAMKMTSATVANTAIQIFSRCAGSI
jgi:hypothetical protein